MDESSSDNIKIQFSSDFQHYFLIGACLDFYNLHLSKDGGKYSIIFTNDSFFFIRNFITEVNVLKNNLIERLPISYLYQRIQYPENRSTFKFIGTIQKVDKIRICFKENDADCYNPEIFIR